MAAVEPLVSFALVAASQDVGRKESVKEHLWLDAAWTALCCFMIHDFIAVLHGCTEVDMGIHLKSSRV